METLFREISIWGIPFFLLFIPIYGYARGVKVYEVFIEGAKEGFNIAVRIIPYLVAMMVAVSLFRNSGMLDLLGVILNPLLKLMSIPIEVIPLALMRPFSGGGALGIAAELINNYGADSLIGRIAATMQGSTDTTFFVLTVYFGSVGVKRYRYSLAVGLLADVTTFLASVYIVNKLFL
ncbi:MAG: spore maturation protein [Clostridia bacterium]|jgi:spore maturation protein B|nr:spore maturation protein [Clostridia bacterium]